MIKYNLCYHNHKNHLGNWADYYYRRIVAHLPLNYYIFEERLPHCKKQKTLVDIPHLCRACSLTSFINTSYSYRAYHVILGFVDE